MAALATARDSLPRRRNGRRHPVLTMSDAMPPMRWVAPEHMIKRTTGCTGANARLQQVAEAQ
jgi:hypothetical protein